MRTLLARIALALGGAAVIANAACGSKRAAGVADAGPALATAGQERRLDGFTVRGQLPAGWGTDVSGRLAAKERVADLDVVVMSLDFDAVAGPGVTVVEMKREMQRRKAQALRVFAGDRPEIVEDLAETEPGIWTLVTRLAESAFPGQWSYHVAVFHLPEHAGTMFVCTGEARLTSAGYWRALRDVCADLAFAR
jgi:hypothetical protein